MNRIKTQHETLDIVVNANTEAQAMENVFQQVKQQAYQNCQGYLIEMHVTSFEVQSIEEKTEIKKFLYFFLPKELKQIQLQARVQITMNYIERDLQLNK